MRPLRCLALPLLLAACSGERPDVFVTFVPCINGQIQLGQEDPADCANQPPFVEAGSLYYVVRVQDEAGNETAVDSPEFGTTGLPEGAQTFLWITLDATAPRRVDTSRPTRGQLASPYRLTDRTLANFDWGPDFCVPTLFWQGTYCDPYTAGSGGTVEKPKHDVRPVVTSEHQNVVMTMSGFFLVAR